MAYLVMVAVSLWSQSLEIDLLRQAASGLSISEADAVASDNRQVLVGRVFLLVLVVTAIMFLRWTALANRNARSLVTTGLEFTPGWAAGLYFVPILAFWKPYQALKEIFKASHPDFGDDWEQAPAPGILPLWWTLWIVATFAGQVGFRSSHRAQTTAQLLQSSREAFVEDALNLPLGIVVIALVVTLQRWQSEKHRRCGAPIAV
jgi:hypothetical protein